MPLSNLSNSRGGMTVTGKQIAMLMAMARSKLSIHTDERMLEWLEYEAAVPAKVYRLEDLTRSQFDVVVGELREMEDQG